MKKKIASKIIHILLANAKLINETRNEFPRIFFPFFGLKKENQKR